MNWLIALREEPDNAELCDRFDTWLAAGQDNVNAWREVQRVWQLLGDTPRAKPVEQSLVRRSPHSRFATRALAATAAAVALVCLLAIAMPWFTIWLDADYNTATGETRQIVLADGSTVYLGPRSAMAVEIEQQARRVKLLAGEAFFEVVPDAKRPFEVDANGVQTTVLGTGFDVRLSSDSVAVAVEHGRVRVASPDASSGLEDPLLAGDWVRVGSNGAVERGNDPPELVASWRDGLLVVRDQRISDVIDEIRRHYRGKVVVADPGLGAKRVTGVYDLKRPLDALVAVVGAHGARIRQAGPWLAVASRY